MLVSYSTERSSQDRTAETIVNRHMYNKTAFTKSMNYIFLGTQCTGHVEANTSFTGVTGRWGLLSHAENAVRLLALSIWKVHGKAS